MIIEREVEEVAYKSLASNAACVTEIEVMMHIYVRSHVGQAAEAGSGLLSLRAVRFRSRSCARLASKTLNSIAQNGAFDRKNFPAILLDFLELPERAVRDYFTIYKLGDEYRVAVACHSFGSCAQSIPVAPSL